MADLLQFMASLITKMKILQWIDCSGTPLFDRPYVTNSKSLDVAPEIAKNYRGNWLPFWWWEVCFCLLEKVFTMRLSESSIQLWIWIQSWFMLVLFLCTFPIFSTCPPNRCPLKFAMAHVRHRCRPVSRTRSAMKPIWPIKIGVQWGINRDIQGDIPPTTISWIRLGDGYPFVQGVSVPFISHYKASHYGMDDHNIP